MNNLIWRDNVWTFVWEISRSTTFVWKLFLSQALVLFNPRVNEKKHEFLT